MKTLTILNILVCLVISNFAHATEEIKLPTTNTTEAELARLRKNEAILNEIIRNSEIIQLRDGNTIDLRNLENFRPSGGLENFKPSQITNALREVMGPGNGGTGGGG
jgi:hypothetical protein